MRGQARIEKRLLYWQEALLTEFSGATGLPAPNSLDETIALFCVKPTTLACAGTGERMKLVEEPVVREFRSIKQNASGGSHVTVFEVRMSPGSNAALCMIEDMAGPHEDISVATVIMESLAQGVSSFLADQQERGNCISGFNVQLLSYVYNSTDFKPSKHQLGMHFLLRDLLSETLTGRLVRAKLVGIPL